VHNSLSVSGFLRSATAPDHEAVDAAFAIFDLSDRDQYRRFLLAHARAVFAVEGALTDADRAVAWSSRRAMIERDLVAMGAAAPLAMALALPGDAAAAWGMAYVLEGSRLGGRLLARRVGAGLPVDYLGAAHDAGGWQAFRDDLDRAEAGPAWRGAALGGARDAFNAFRESAAM
jgi:heme oxygenase